MTGPRLDRIEIHGYKSIETCDLRLRDLNVLVGPNGAGKSNFISALGLLGSIVNGGLQLSVGRSGGASTLLHGGPKVSDSVQLHTYFGSNQYVAKLVGGAQDDLLFEREICYFQMQQYADPYSDVIGTGHRESNLAAEARAKPGKVAAHCLDAMRSWRVFHFHDTSAQTGAKKKQPIGDNAELRPDAANLAPFLYRLQQSHPSHFARISDSVRLIAPFSKDSALRPTESMASGFNSNGSKSVVMRTSTGILCLMERSGSSALLLCYFSLTRRQSSSSMSPSSDCIRSP